MTESKEVLAYLAKGGQIQRLDHAAKSTKIEDDKRAAAKRGHKTNRGNK